MATLEFEGSKIHYEVSGQGEPLVFIHEWNTSSGLFKKVNLKDFQEHFRVILLDLPGFGRSESLRELTLENLTRVIHAVMSRNQAEQAVVMGSCLGAIVALDFALRRPALVRKLVLLEVIVEFPKMLAVLFWPLLGAGLFHFFARTRPGLYLFDRLMWRSNRSGPGIFYKKLLFRMFRNANRASAYRYLKMLHQALRVDYYSLARTLQARTLCLCGADTPDFIRECARKVHRNLRGGELAFVQRCRHFLLLEKPQEIFALVRGFTGRI